jgi:hypothetical protein
MIEVLKTLGFVLLTILGVAALIFGPVTYIGNIVSERACYAQTANIGYPARYDFWQGCQIEVESGRWIPLSAYYWKGGAGG